MFTLGTLFTFVLAIIGLAVLSGGMIFLGLGDLLIAILVIMAVYKFVKKHKTK